LEYDENTKLPVISPEIFIEGLKALEVDNISELELACLMQVLVKPQLDNGILIEELESIIENAPQILGMVRCRYNYFRKRRVRTSLTHKKMFKTCL
jgi:hypothetical protein